MISREVRVASKVGLHARPASIFVTEVAKGGILVTIAKEGGDPVDARSILGVMSLGVRHNELVTLSAEGERAEDVLDGLVELLSRDLDA